MQLLNSWFVSDSVWYVLSLVVCHVKYLMHDIRRRTSDIGHQISDIRHRTSDIGHRTSDTYFTPTIKTRKIYNSSSHSRDKSSKVFAIRIHAFSDDRLKGTKSRRKVTNFVPWLKFRPNNLFLSQSIISIQRAKDSPLLSLLKLLIELDLQPKEVPYPIYKKPKAQVTKCPVNKSFLNVTLGAGSHPVCEWAYRGFYCWFR